MDEFVMQYEVKFKKLLEKFLDPEFQIRNDVYINTLFTHLSGKHNKELSEKLLKLQIFPEWILKACAFWEKRSIHPSPCTSAFILHLTGLLSKDERRFTYFKTFNLYNTMCSLLKVKAVETPVSTKLAYLRMLMSFLEHKSGLDWLISTDNWRDGLVFSLEGQTIYLVREGRQFILNLLKQSIDYNVIFCDLLVKRIMIKLNDFQSQINVQGFPEVREEALIKYASPILKLISFILEKYVETESRDYRIPMIFINNNQLEQSIWKISAGIQTSDVLLDIDKILVCTYFLQTFISPTEIISSPDLKRLGTAINKLINHCLTGNHHHTFLKLCHYIDYIGSFLRPRITGNEVSMMQIENQLMPLQVLPAIIVTFKYCSSIMKDLEADDVRDVFVSKLFKSMNEQTTRTAYNWKNILLDQEEAFSLAHQALVLIINSRKYYSTTRTIMIFQSTIYAFKDVITSVKDGYLNVDLFVQNAAYVISLINCLSTFINENDIPWTESVETICVLNMTLEFMALATWSTRVIIEALKLLNLAIAKYMSPNLALLIDKTQDSALDHIGPLIINKLHDENWEVRDSALEILTTISTFACSKFPSFQKVIIDSDLLTLVLNMAVSDSESFVRASSIKCLQEMIKVSEFWNPILIQKDLPKIIITTLNEETEAIVRTEAAHLVRCIYEHQAFPVDMMDDVYETMVAAATTDLHWEVKMNALDFWGKVTLNHLQYQGMLDGKFPDVTFSKEHKKIVTLTDNEIKHRLSKVLHQLSKCGCLGVFVTAIQDECDIEVMKRAAEKLKKFRLLIQRYSLDKLYAPPASPSTSSSSLNRFQHQTSTVSSLNTPPVTPGNPRMDYSDEVIDEIINSADVNLLTAVCQNNSELNGSPASNHTNNNLKLSNIKNVSPEVFLSVLQADIDSMVEEKTKWLQNIDDLNSLLDDMLGCYNGDINGMDCY